MSKHALLAIAFASLVAASPAAAIDLSGTWEGSFTCKRFGVVEQETVTEKTKDSVLRILQAGEAFDAEIDGTATYRGKTIDAATDGARRGEAVLVSCDSDPLPLDGGVHEIVRFKAKVDAAKGTGTLTGESLTEHGQLGIMSCKLKFKRTSAAVAKFPTCGP
jgi:hypothetical protein